MRLKLRLFYSEVLHLNLAFYLISNIQILVNNPQCTSKPFYTYNTKIRFQSEICLSPFNSKRIWTFEQNSLKMLNSSRKYLFIGKLHALVEFKTKIRIFYFHVHWSTCESYHYFIEPRLNIALSVHSSGLEKFPYIETVLHKQNHPSLQS